MQRNNDILNAEARVRLAIVITYVFFFFSLLFRRSRAEIREYKQLFEGRLLLSRTVELMIGESLPQRNIEKYTSF